MKPDVLWKMIATALGVILFSIVIGWASWVSLALVGVPDAGPIWGAIKELRKFHYEKHAK